MWNGKKKGKRNDFVICRLFYSKSENYRHTNLSTSKIRRLVRINYRKIFTGKTKKGVITIKLYYIFPVRDSFSNKPFYVLNVKSCGSGPVVDPHRFLASLSDSKITLSLLPCDKTFFQVTTVVLDRSRRTTSSSSMVHSVLEFRCPSRDTQKTT